MLTLNKVCLIGRLGQPPKLFSTRNGRYMCTFTLATDESYVTKSGEKVERTEWHRITAFGKLAEQSNINLSKGRLVYIEGSLATRKWYDKNNVEHYTTEVTMQRIIYLDKPQHLHTTMEDTDTSGYDSFDTERAVQKNYRKAQDDMPQVDEFPFYGALQDDAAQADTTLF